MYTWPAVSTATSSGKRSSAEVGEPPSPCLPSHAVVIVVGDINVACVIRHCSIGGVQTRRGCGSAISAAADSTISGDRRDLASRVNSPYNLVPCVRYRELAAKFLPFGMLNYASHAAPARCSKLSVLFSPSRQLPHALRSKEP